MFTKAGKGEGGGGVVDLGEVVTAQWTVNILVLQRLASLPLKVTDSNWHHLRVGDYRCFDRTGHYIGLPALGVVSACTYDIRSH